MNKLFHFDCLQEVYTADACVISCIDARFDQAIKKFLKRQGIAIFDHVKIPGSVKWLVSPEREGDRDFVLSMVRTSMRLHKPPRALLFGHKECGAYPGAPDEVVCTDVLRAAGVLLAAEPSLAVDCFFAAFDGIYALS